jgi:hypothetical protein
MFPHLTKEQRRVSLKDVEHIFMPIERDARGPRERTEKIKRRDHAALLVVSPSSHLIEFFDSLHYAGEEYIYLALKWLAYELQNLFKLENWAV